MRTLIAIALVLGAASSARAQSAKPPAKAQAIVLASPDAATYGAAPAILPAGAKLAVLEGNPMAAGRYTMRLWMPAGYRIQPHFHAGWEHVTVIKGSFHVGMGATFDNSKGTVLETGAFGALPPGMRHFAWTNEETVIQLHGVGPWQLTYVNPADNPAKSTHSRTR
jgi:hypothetical protein